MKKRILAILLAGLMIFDGQSITALAVESESAVIAETAEAESEVAQQDEQETEKVNGTEAESPSSEKVETESSEAETPGSSSEPTETETETKSSSEESAETETSVSEPVSESVSESESESVSESSETTETQTETEMSTEQTDVAAETTDGFTYSNSGSNATITGYTGSATEITIPETVDGYTVVSIGNYSFQNKTTITSVTIPNSVTSIGYSAFKGCTALSSVALGSGLTSIGSYAFENCTVLSSITIPKSVTSISSYAFKNSISSISFESGMSAIPQNACQGASNLTSVTMPATVTSIGNNAFRDCTGLTSLTDSSIGSNVTSIGNNAFQGCTGLTSVTIPNNVETLGNNAFYGCSTLSGVTLGSGLTSIGSSAFENCTALSSITIPKSVTSISSNAFTNSISSISFETGMTTIPANVCRGANNLTTVGMPATVTEIGNYAFYNCTKLTGVTLGSGVRTIGSYVFSGCTNLASVTIPDNIETLGSYVFNGCTGLTSVTLGSGLTTIGSYCFQGCNQLTAIVIPDGVSTLGSSAFNNCTTLSSIQFGSGLTEIGSNCFAGCTSLTTLTVPKNITSIGNGAFSSVLEISFEEGMTTIPANACYGAKKLTKVTIPDSVTEIGSSAFRDCTAITGVSFGSNLTTIGDYAFSGCTALTSVVIPKNVTSMGYRSFYNSVVEIEFADGTTAIPENACNGANKLTTIKIPGSVKAIGDNAFKECASITTVTLSDGVTSIGNSAFSGCTGLATINIPATLQTLGDSAFYNCKKISSITLNDKLTAIGSSCFSNCTLLETLTIPKSVTTIGYRAFYNSVKEITFADGMTAIPDNACQGANYLTKVTIPDTVLTLGNYAFYDCSKITEVTIGKNVTSIGEACFQNCSSLTSITIPTKVKTIGQEAFAYCKSLTTVEIPDGATVGSYCYSNCTGLTDIVIGDDVTLGDYIFYRCSNIKSIKVGQNLTKTEHSFSGAVLSGTCGDNLIWELSLDAGTLDIAGDGAMTEFATADDVPWAYLGSLVKYLTIDENITTISSYAFKDFDNLESIVIPDKVTSIGQEAFFSCDQLRYVEIPSSVTSIGARAFAECKSLTEIVYCGDAPNLGADCMPDMSSLTVYYPETGTGWIARLIAKFASINWKVWDNTLPTKDVVLVLDTSGSMYDRMDGLKEAASKFVDAVGGRLYNTRIAIVEYNSSARLVCDFSTDKSGQIAKINQLESGGGTQYINALNKADEVLKNSKADYQFIVMFSDGQPFESEDEISALATKLRESYYIYTVGLISDYDYGDSSQKQILVSVAGSEDRYFEASNIEGLVEAFLALAEDFGKNENTTVEIKRHNERRDLLTTEEAFCVGSQEYASIYVTPGTKHSDVASVSLQQNGQEILTSADGVFENIVPGSIFAQGQKVYATLYDSKGSVIESLALKIDMREYFVITYNMNDGTNTIYKTENVINGEEINAPEDPERDGFVFRGWYSVQSCTGIPFFSFLNIYNRATIEGDVQLYAKWKRSADTFEITEDAWSFTNNNNYFHCTTKEISSGDYSKLIADLDESTKQDVDDYKNNGWNGSCFGMSSAVALMRAGVISVTDFDANCMMPGDVTTLYYNKNGDADVGSIESMINFYHLRQKIGKIKEVRGSYDRSNESANIERVIGKLRNNTYPVVMTIALYSGSSSLGGHAVVAYGLEESDDGTATFKVYDCSMGNGYNGYGQEYTVSVSKNGNTYTKSCDDWVDDWNKGIGADSIYIKTALSVTELQQESILVAPSVILGRSQGSTDTGYYTMNTSYGSFTITDGNRSATISGGQKTSGDLDIECNGQVNYVGEAPDYEFELPVLSDGASYTITTEAAGDIKVLYTDSKDGFYSSVNTSGAGTITISSTGEVTTKFADKTSQKIKATRNDIATSWYTITVNGEDTGLKVKADREQAAVSSDSAVNVNIALNNDFNKVNFDNIPVDSTGVSVVENSDGSCNIKKGEQIIATNGFGYSVVFDSQCGTPVDTLVNVPNGGLVTEPQDPHRDGYIFEGWYKEDTCENLWDFETDQVTDNLILYAGWSIDSNYFVTVTFKIPGYDNQTIYVAKGSQLELSQCPEIKGNEDKSWYREDKYARKWDFVNDVVIENTTLYAKGKNCNISFETGCATKIEPYTIYAGSYLTNPDTVLEREGYTLCGWSVDADFREDWDFDTDKVMDDTKLYARWVANEKDKNGNDTKICIDVLRPNSYVFSGKPVTPNVVVRDGDKILEINKDYKVSYKNNKDACDIDGSGVKDSKKPQVIVQGIGSYKANKKFTKYFSIQQADFADLTVSVPDYVAAKPNDKVQQIKPTVRMNHVTLAAKDYTVAYYKDSELKQAVSGLGAAGTYYIVVEAKKDASGTYTGNYKGKTDAVEVNVASAKLVLSGAKVSYAKKPDCLNEDISADAAIQKMITQITIDGATYQTSDIETFRKYFAVTAVDADGTNVSQAKLAKVLKTAGEKTININAVDGNDKGYVGSVSVKINVQGINLNKNQFRLTYDRQSAKPVTTAEYTGKALVPEIISDLTKGTDYTVTYMYNKKEVNPSQIINAGSYSAVIKGINQYSGSLSIKFTIGKVNLAKAYAAKKITITSNGTVSQNLAGAKAAYTVSYDADGANGDSYRKVALTEGTDYAISYKNNTKVTKSRSLAYAMITGKGNYTGTLKGDGKTKNITNAKSGIANELNFEIMKKALSSSEISIVVNGITYKKGKPTVKFSLYDNGKKIASKEYKAYASMSGNTVTLSAYAKDGNYSGSVSKKMSTDLTRTSDAKKVKITYKDSGKFYYTGSQILPEITITDAYGNDISENFTVSYGDNTKVGLGTITITGKLENGYCDMKVLKFTILPKWMKWIF